MSTVQGVPGQLKDANILSPFFDYSLGKPANNIERKYLLTSLEKAERWMVNHPTALHLLRT